MRKWFDLHTMKENRSGNSPCLYAAVNYNSRLPIRYFRKLSLNLLNKITDSILVLYRFNFKDKRISVSLS